MKASLIRYTHLLSERMIHRLLSKLEYGTITLISDNMAYHYYGQRNQENSAVTINIHDKKFFSSMLLTGTNAAADSYIAGHWDVDNLTTLIEMIIQNKKIFQRIDNKFTFLARIISNVREFISYNDKKNAKKNILAHYDLGNEFFQLFLDKQMLYSCALYESDEVDLEAASAHKLRTICNALDLQPDDHLLEIGSGWGGLAIFAATEYGCRVTTTTISDKQYQYVKKEVARIGMQNQITVLNKDYRDLTGLYDKIVSIEMIEAVGSAYFKTFFKKCNALLKSNGLFFLQAITINDQAYHQAKNDVDFIKKYIFPGGCLPSMAIINQVISKHTQMRLIQCDDIGHHYSRTLSDWMTRFYQSIDQIKSFGFSDDFIRTWIFYFCYCIAGFRQAHISNIHALWQKNSL